MYYKKIIFFIFAEVNPMVGLIAHDDQINDLTGGPVANLNFGKQPLARQNGQLENLHEQFADGFDQYRKWRQNT